MLIRNATLPDGRQADIRIESGTICDIAAALHPYRAEPIIEANTGAVLPGLHDHHIHLLALAASLTSFDCGVAGSATELANALRTASHGKASLRAVNYHEGIAGEIDRLWLDNAVPHIPLRVQHRSGRLWILNSAALQEVSRHEPQAGRNTASAAPCGHIYDGDTWLRGYFSCQAPSLAQVGRLLAERGVTAVTDATPSNGVGFFDIVARAQASGDLPQRVAVMGTTAIAAVPPAPDMFPLAVKLHLHEGDYPAPETFFHLAHTARSAGLTLAVHCVTEPDLIFTVSLLEECGCANIARIEHASLVPPDMLPRLAAAGITIVTQPHFITERGDAYVHDIPALEHHNLYRCATLKSAGIKLGGGTDAPFGNYDPWSAMAAATTRRPPNGTILGRDEILSPEAALAMFTTKLTDPGGAPRRIEPGEPADICLLTQPWAIAREQLDTISVQATIRGGTLIHNNIERTRWGRKVA